MAKSEAKTECSRLATLANGIYRQIEKKPLELQNYYDFQVCIGEYRRLKKQTRDRADWSYECSRLEWTEENKEIHRLNRGLQDIIREAIKDGGSVVELWDIFSDSLLYEAPWDFEQYMLYIEIDRSPEDKFYQPRRKALKPIVDALQDIEDGELVELFISQPPRTGKSTLMLFFLTWEMGKHPLMSNLYSACSDTLTKSTYNGLMEILRDPLTYHWDKVFPNMPIVQTNAADETINILKRNRFPTITCRSIDGTLNGACDCSNIQLSDDLVTGIEEAKNKDRMVNLWQKVDNDFLTRAKTSAKRIWIGTRWSIYDPIGVRLELLSEDARFQDVKYKVVNVPALNDKDESNFNYDYGVGFDSEYYRQRRASFEHNNDMASWSAQYMGEPIEREGSLFTSGEFRYYNGSLPTDRPPDRVYCACDPAFGGSDYVASPCCIQYGSDIYVPGVVYDNGDKKKTIPLLANMIERFAIGIIQVEATKATESYAEELQKLLKRRGIYCTVVTKPAPSTMSKTDRIMDKAPDIKDHMIFLEPSLRPTEYQKFMENVFNFKIYSKKQHDDAPDSLSMAISMAFRSSQNRGHIFRRFF